MDCRVAAAKNGANVVLHHLGGPTIKEMSQVVSELEKIGGKHVVVEGDISDPEVSKLVSNLISQLKRNASWRTAR